MSQITLSKTALFSILQSAADTDDGWPDKPGPFGPIIRERLYEALLGPYSLPWRASQAGPQPDPWRARTAARTIISAAVARLQTAEALSTDNASTRSGGIVGAQVMDDIGDICGNGPHRIPIPHKHGPWSGMELLIAAAEFASAAEFKGPLQASFAAASDQLLKTGLQRTERPEHA